MLIHSAIDDDVHPPRSGGAQRAFGLARGLAARHDVRMLCLVPNRSRAPAEERADGVTLVRRRAWHTSAAWRLDRLGLAPLFTAVSGHRANARRYAQALGGTPDVLSCELHLTGMLEASRARLRVYASQNVEADRFSSSPSRMIARSHWVSRLRALEGGAVRSADLTVACSEEDSARFRELYGARADQLIVVPNGFDERMSVPASAAEREAARAGLDLPADAHVALFVGADWGPNREALEFLTAQVLPPLASSGVRLVVAGSVSRALAGRREPWLRVLGRVDDLRPVLHAADSGLNPMAAGGGSNVKVPGYLAAGLACITTSFGIRGYAPLAPHCVVVERPAFAEALRARPRGWSARGEAAPAPLADYQWSALGERLGRIYEKRLASRASKGAA